MQLRTQRSFRDEVAIITGGASGIGLAVGQQLARRGAAVILADVKREQAEQAARAIAETGEAAASGVGLDVTDAAAVAQVIETAAEQHGRLDYVFNNAGIAIAAEARDHDLDDWYRTFEVNLRGVVHGVQAAYPVMLAQGFGHIVNTASLAGLIPAVNEIAYVAAKHAVVGLSTALRAEAADLGVKVSVVCPGFVDTPILYENLSLKYADELGFKSRQDVMSLFPFKPMPVDRAAAEIIDGVARNEAIIVVTPHAKLLWLLQRLHPSLLQRLGRSSIRKSRRRRGAA